MTRLFTSSSNPMSTTHNLQPMDAEQARFWQLRRIRHASVEAPQSPPTTDRAGTNRGAHNGRS